MRHVRRSVIKRRKRNQRGVASVSRVNIILCRGPSLTDKLGVLCYVVHPGKISLTTYNAMA